MDLNDLIFRLLMIFGLGGIGLYSMLPRGGSGGQRFFRYVGGGVLTFVLLQLVTLPLTSDAARTVLSTKLPGLTFTGTFLVLAIVSLASAVMMITSRNPVYSALWFAMVLLSNSGLYLLQGAEFLAAATIIIYAGAIIVTFLFVIMLAQPGGTAKYDRISREPFLACVAGAVLASVLAGSLRFSAVTEIENIPANAEAVADAEKSGKKLRPGPAAAELTVVTTPATLVGAVEPANKNGDDAKAAPALAPLPRQYIDTRLRQVDGKQVVPSHVRGLGVTLLRDHYVSLEVMGVLLLVAVAGAVLIVGHRTEVKG